MCRTGCPTQDHSSYGECLRAANAGVAFGSAYRASTDRELAEYRQLRKEGIQPMGTTRHALDQAKAMSDRFGGAWSGETGLVNGKVPMRTGELV